MHLNIATTDNKIFFFSFFQHFETCLRVRSITIINLNFNYMFGRKIHVVYYMWTNLLCIVCMYVRVLEKAKPHNVYLP